MIMYDRYDLNLKFNEGSSGIKTALAHEQNHKIAWEPKHGRQVESSPSSGLLIMRQRRDKNRKINEGKLNKTDIIGEQVSL